MEGNHHSLLHEVSADEIRRQIQAYALYCAISPTGSNSTKGVNSQNSWSAGGDPLEKPSGKEHAERDFDLYMDIVPGASSQSKIYPKEFGCVVLIKVSF